MNKNYLVGSIVKAQVFPNQTRTGFVVEIFPNSCLPIVVQFLDGKKVKFDKMGKDIFKYYSNLEVIGHQGQDIAIDFANYCISEGYGTDARPQDFQKFLETYKPNNNG